MGILNKMDPIDRAKHLIEQLKDLKDKLQLVSKRLEEMKKSKNIDVDEYERLFEKEFEISMSLYGLYEDIDKILDNAKNTNNEFVIKRLKQEINKVFKPVILEI